jgi:hypothetical protein
MLGKWDKYILQHRASVRTDKRRARQTDRQTDIGQRKGLTGRQTNIQTDRHMGREKECQADRQAY